MSTKIPAPTVEAMRQRIAPLDCEANRAAYRDGNFPRADRGRDLDRRYRWDLYWAAQCQPILDQANIEGLLDSHIDTALRAIVRPL